MKYKNYYEILGLKGPKVTEDEIKISYRKLAKKYHPDIHPGDTLIQDKFKDINEAYQILTDEDEKFKYNLKYYIHSVQDKLNINNFKIKVDGNGMSEISRIFLGDEDNEEKKGEDIFINIDMTMQEAFNGITKEIAFKNINGKLKKLTIKIPRGMNNGDNIRLQGEGKKPKFGEKNGDLFVITNIKNDADYKLEKNNLITNLKISPVDAILGKEFKIESIDGTYNLKVSEGSYQGQKYIIKDAGYIDKNGKRGDLIVYISLEIPKNISNEEKELYKKIRDLQDKHNS